MITLMNENNLEELEIEKEGMRIRLKKVGTSQEAFNGPVMIEREKVLDTKYQEASQAPGQKADANTVEIKAPMVGTFYGAPSPESAPFVEALQVIEPGQVICIIEAMKLMNEIKSEIKGKVLEVLIDNAEPVEFGQPLFLIEPL